MPADPAATNAPPAQVPGQQQQQQQRPTVAEIQRARAAAAAAAAPKKGLLAHCTWQALPWWVVFIVAIYLTYKVGLTFDSPCAVLGVPSPTSRSLVNKAYRKLSICTHPDKLVGASASEKRRGEVLFTRVTKARDFLVKAMKKHKMKKWPCFQGELELAIMYFFGECMEALAATGVSGSLEGFYYAIKHLVTFEAGFFGTISQLLLLSFFWRMLSSLFSYVRHLGPVQLVVTMILNCIIGPIPTVLRFFLSPFYRVEVFITEEVLASGKKKKAAEGPEEGEAPSPASSPRTAHLPAASGDDDQGPRPGLRRRKPQSQSAQDAQREDQLLGRNQNSDAAQAAPVAASAAAAAGAAAAPGSPQRGQPQPPRAAPVAVGIDGYPLDLRAIIARQTPEPNLCRSEAAKALKSDYLLTLTKPVIPLLMLVSTGQVFNGLLSSLFIGHGLRNWTPDMKAETLHVLLVIFGVLHTLLGSSAEQHAAQMDHAQQTDMGESMLRLNWQWSFRDVLAIANLIQLGATFSSVSSLGNEPLFTVSFAAGVALKMFLGEVTPPAMAKKANNMLKEAQITIANADEEVVRSYNGIGGCGGGVFRCLFGDESLWGKQGPAIAATVVQLFLLILPVLNALQWAWRLWKAHKSVVKEQARTKPRPVKLRIMRRRMLASGFVLVVSVFLCVFICTFHFNATNGSLSNFWVAVLFGSLFESLLMTYEVRGSVRQLVFLFIFIFV